MKPQQVMCYNCEPPKPISEHIKFNGVWVHERTDRPLDTLYMVSENTFKIIKEDLWKNHNKRRKLKSMIVNRIK